MCARTIVHLATLAVLLGILGAPAGGQETQEERPPAAPPQWFLDHVERMTAGTGTWIAANPEDQRGAAASHDAYGQQWEAGIGGKSLKGRLYALEDGEEVGTFWEFRTYWHPGQRRIIVEQFHPSGSYGVGEVIRTESGRERTDQTFWWVTGAVTRGGHEAWFEDGDHMTQSYSVDSEGVWHELRFYRWEPQPAKP